MAATPVGAAGTVLVTGAVGVTGVEGADSADRPAVFTVVTVKVTGVPLVSPVTLRLLAEAETPVIVRDSVPLAKTFTVKLAIPVADATLKLTVAWVLPATTEVMVGATGGASRSVWSANFNCSTLNSVSRPSPVAGAATVAGAEVLSATVTEPFALLVIVYWDSGPAKVAVSQFLAAVPAAQSAGLVSLFTISRTATRLPGSTRPAKTACWRVMLAGTGTAGVPKVPEVALFSIRSVRPTSVAGLVGSVRTLMATRSSLSPSMISSPVRPVIVSLPGPPSRMSPSPQTGPVSGQKPETERDDVWAAVPTHSLTGGRRFASPETRATPVASSASH